MSPVVRPSFLGIAGCCLLAVQLGCSKELPTVDDVKQSLSNTVEDVKQTADLAGNVELQLDQPVKTSGCYVALHKQQQGRPNILQITSYNDPSGESFPSFFLRSLVKQNELSELSGQTVPAEIFVQENPDGAVWHSPPDQEAQLSITSVDGNQVRADFQGTLINAETGATKQVSGSLTGAQK